MFDTNKLLDHKQFYPEKGTRITNFSTKDLMKYAQAIEIYSQQNPNHGLVISPFAYSLNKEWLDFMNSLHYTNPENKEVFDLSEFWRIFETINHKNQ